MIHHIEGQVSRSHAEQNDALRISPSGSRNHFAIAQGLRSNYGSQAQLQSVNGMSRGNRISMRNTVKLNMVELKDESEEDQNFTNS